jgi:hypothetical protein
MLRRAVLDMVSNTFFSIVVAVNVTLFHDEGVDASVELIAPPSKSFAALRFGEVDFVAGPAHAAVSAFPPGGERICSRGVRQHLCPDASTWLKFPRCSPLAGWKSMVVIRMANYRAEMGTQRKTGPART